MKLPQFSEKTFNKFVLTLGLSVITLIALELCNRNSMWLGGFWELTV